MSELAVLDERAGTALAFRYTPSELRQWVAHLDEMRRAILQDGTDFTVIPGTQKPTLLKPGAEKLLMAAGLGFTIERIPEPGTDARQGVTYRTTIRRGDEIVAQCDGYAGYDEDRFYQASAQRRIEAERRERANAARYQRAVQPKKWEDLPEEDYRAPWNSVMKMAEKRSLVGAVLNALAASGLFTQDLEDMPSVDEPTTWDVGELLKPWLQQVYKIEGAREELRQWTAGNNYPERPKDFNQTQATALLVHIGTILGARQQTSAVEGGDHPSPPTTAEEDPQPSGSEAKAATEARDEDAGAVASDDGPPPSVVAATPEDRVSEAFKERVAEAEKPLRGLLNELEAQAEALRAEHGAQEEEDPLGVGSERTQPAQASFASDAEDKATGDTPEVPEGSVSWDFARRQLAGHATASGNPLAQTAEGAFEVAGLALASHGLGPVSRDELAKMLTKVEPWHEGDPDPLAEEPPTASALEARAAEIASKRRRPEPAQQTLVDQS